MMGSEGGFKEPGGSKRRRAEIIAIMLSNFFTEKRHFRERASCREFFQTDPEFLRGAAFLKSSLKL
jgi:hypothetical protein